jgi:hypothetical protein
MCALREEQQCMRFFLTMMLSVVLTAGTTQAQAYNVMGRGLDSCGAWITHRRDVKVGAPITANSEIADEETNWVVGFLSGVGFMGRGNVNPLDGMDAEGILAWIDNYCRAHPIERIVEAAGAFFYAHPK